MPLQILRDDLTRIACDAVVNPTNAFLIATGGLDRRLRDAAGPELDEACARIGVLAAGTAVLTPGYRLPARWVIHTAGPVWQGGTCGEAAVLAQCYRACLALAEAQHLRSVAFPVIAAGNCCFPKAQALEIAVTEIRAFLETHEMEILLVVYNRECYEIGAARYHAVQSFLDEVFEDPYEGRNTVLLSYSMSDAAPSAPRPAAAPRPEQRPRPAAKQQRPAALPSAFRPGALPDYSGVLDESFSQMLLRKIDERGITDAQCYKKANVDRKLFSKIRNDVHYQPRKPTVIAFAVALELSLSETRELLEKAGFALSRSYRFDVIIEYFIRSGNYDIYEINEALFAFDQPLLGA